MVQWYSVSMQLFGQCIPRTAIMTIPKILNFWNVDTPKPENAEKNTGQAVQIVQTDHLTGHAADQTFFFTFGSFVDKVTNLCRHISWHCSII